MFCLKIIPRASPLLIYSLMNKAHFKTFTGVKDRYNGITVDSSKENIVDEFEKRLKGSLSTWKSEGKRCIWFKIYIKDSICIPVLAEKGFNFHHARDDFVMMFKWLPSHSKSNLPPTCHTMLGVGALVFNDKKQLLAISEKHYEYPHWKLPGGYVEKGEDIVDAAVREVKEETGVDAAFESLITFRHTHNVMFGNSDIYVILMMKAIKDKITIAQSEVQDCKWMDVDEYLNHPHVHALNRLVVNLAKNYSDERRIKLNIRKKTVKWATYERQMNYLSIEDID